MLIGLLNKFFRNFANNLIVLDYCYMTRHIFIIILLFCSFSLGKAQNAFEDYDALSKLSSDALMEKGRAYFEQRVPTKALACFTIVSERYKGSRRSSEAELRVRALNNCGCVYKYSFFDYVQAYSCFIQAYDLCEEAGCHELLPMVLVNLGDLLNDYSVSYHSETLSQQSDDIFNQCINQAFENKNWELLTTAFFNLANQNFSLDLSKYEKIFSSEIPDSTPDLAYVRLLFEGIRNIQQNKYAEARDCFQRQLAVVTARWAADRDSLASYVSIAKSYQLEQNYGGEAEYLEKALKMSVDNSLDDHSSGLCRQLACCYELMGNPERQQYYHALYLEKAEAEQHSHLANIGELNYINELRKKEETAQEMAVLQRTQQYALFAIVIVLLVVVASAVLLWRKNRELNARNRSLFERYRHELQADAESSKYSHSNLNASQKEALIFRIQEILDNAEIICQQDFNLGQLTKLVDSNTTYVSQVINEKYGMTFSTVLANFRIKEACRRIDDERDRYSNITIEGIATGVGFKSRTAFINAFKREVGLTPSEYLRLAAAT